MNVIGSVKKIGIVIAGFAVLGFGLILLVTPGPAIVFIPLGLVILGTQFEWPKRWLEKVSITLNKKK